jgi:hypothetical protein
MIYLAIFILVVAVIGLWIFLAAVLKSDCLDHPQMEGLYKPKKKTAIKRLFFWRQKKQVYGFDERDIYNDKRFDTLKF